MVSIELPLISVVFTSYNHIEFLKQALDSLINQTYKDIEIIIVDDCSTDNSQNILKEYENLPNVIVKLNVINSGSYVKASNYGARFANGDYILFAQCDDYADPTQIEKLVKVALKYPDIGVIFSRSNLVNKDGVFISDDYSIRERKFRETCRSNCQITKQQMFEFLTVSCVIPNLSAALINKDVYQKVKGLSEKYLVAADWEFWLKISEISDFYYISESLNNFRQHNTTIRSKTKIDTQLMEIFNVFADHSNRNKNNKGIDNKLFVGFGNIWFTYFIDAPYPVGLSLFSILIKTTRMNKLMPYFFFKGAFRKVKAILRN